MEKIILSEELLMEILKNSYNDATIEDYLNAAVEGRIASEENDSLLKLLYMIVRFYDDKLFCKTKNDPLDFFGMKKYDENSIQAKYLELLDRTYFEILNCREKGITLPPKKLLVEFYERYAHALYVFGNYFKSLEFCRKALSNDEENPLSIFLKHQ